MTHAAHTGFSEWTRGEFNKFAKACEKHGREAYGTIAEEVASKSEAEVRAYACAS